MTHHPRRRRAGDVQSYHIMTSRYMHPLLLTSLLIISLSGSSSAQKVHPARLKDGEEQTIPVLVAAGDKFNMTCEYEGFDTTAGIVRIQWWKHSTAGLKQLQQVNTSMSRQWYNLKEMYVDFDPGCDPRKGACAANLHVVGTEPADQATYFCTVQSATDGRFEGAHYKVSVLDHYAPNDVSLEQLREDGSAAKRPLDVIEGQEVSFRCRSNGFPSPRLTFTLGDMSVEQLMRIHSIQVSDFSERIQGSWKEKVMVVRRVLVTSTSLKWQCRAANDQGEKRSPVLVTPYNFAPSITLPSGGGGGDDVIQELHAEKNSNFATTCAYKDGYPADTEVRWYQGRDGSGAVARRGKTLSFAAAEMDQDKSGYYTCVVSNAIGQDQYTILLTVNYAPIVQMDQKMVEVTEGEQLSLVCQVNAKPPATVTWSFQGDHPLDLSAHNNRMNLNIPDVQPYYTGTITCSASNSYGNRHDSTYVTVQYPPDVTLTMEPARTRNDYLLGEAVSLKCAVDSVPPPKHISILREDGAWMDDIKSRSGESFKVIDIVALRKDHAGTYTCEAHNGLGVTNKHSIQLRVQYAPVISPMVPQTKNEGSSLTLHCFVDSEPAAVVTWTDPSGNTIGSGNREVLEMSNLRRSHAGQYSCSASVRFYDSTSSSATHTVDVFIRTKPEVTRCDSTDLYSADKFQYFAKLGSSKQLCCQVSAYPEATVRWTKLVDGVPRVLEHRATNTTTHRFMMTSRNVVSIERVSEDDLAEYVCEATNDRGIQPQRFYLSKLNPPGVPNELQAAPEIGHNGVKLQWEREPQATFYQVGYRLHNSGGGGTYQMTDKPAQSESILIRNLSPEERYQFVVKACNEAGCSPFSPAVASRPGVASGASRAPGGGVGANIPMGTVVAVPLVLVGIILLLSLFIVICRKRSSNRRHEKGVSSEEIFNTQIQPPVLSNHKAPSPQQQPSAPPPLTKLSPYNFYVHNNATADRANYRIKGGEVPDGRERVRFTDPDGMTIYPGDKQPPPAPKVDTVATYKTPPPPSANGGLLHPASVSSANKYMTIPSSAKLGGSSGSGSSISPPTPDSSTQLISKPPPPIRKTQRLKGAAESNGNCLTGGGGGPELPPPATAAAIRGRSGHAALNMYPAASTTPGKLAPHAVAPDTSPHSLTSSVCSDQSTSTRSNAGFSITSV